MAIVQGSLEVVQAFTGSVDPEGLLHHLSLSATVQAVLLPGNDGLLPVLHSNGISIEPDTLR